MQIVGPQAFSEAAPASQTPGFRATNTLAVRHRSGDVIRPAAFSPDIAFLLRRGVPETTLDLAKRLAALRGSLPRDELFACGFDRQRYWAMLAADLGLPFAERLDGVQLVAHSEFVTAEAVRSASAALAQFPDGLTAVIAPAPGEIAALRSRVKASPGLASRICIDAPETIRAFLLAHRHQALTHYAVNRLSRVMPRLSARRLDLSHGPRGPVALAAALAATALLAPNATLALWASQHLFFANCGSGSCRGASQAPRQLRSSRFRTISSRPTRSWCRSTARRRWFPI
jgi:hypothetical protein